MFASIRVLAYGLVRSLMTTKQQILMILYFGYIWDTVRREEVESRKRCYYSYCKEHQVLSGSMLWSNESEDDSTIKKRSGRKLSNRAESKADRQIVSSEEYDWLDGSIPEMPKIARRYQLFSTAYHFFNTIKYGLISSISYGLLSIDKSYACYLPGRVFLTVNTAYEAPWWGFMLSGSHVIWRAVWHLGEKRMKLDCLLFLTYDRATVIDKQFAISSMNDRTLPAPVIAKMYLHNKVFYERHSDREGRATFSVKQNRRLKHFDRLERLLMKFRILYLILVTLFCMIPASYGMALLGSSEFVKQYYPSCTVSDGFSGKMLRQTLVDNYRYLYSIFDMLDMVVVTIDNAFAVIIPYSGAILMTQDLVIRFDSLCKRLSTLNETIRLLLMSEEYSLIRSPLANRFLSDYREESKSIFHETLSLFEQVRSVDIYMRRFISFIFFACYWITLTIIVTLIFRRQSMSDDMFVIYTYCLVHTQFGLMLTTYRLAQPQNRSLVLYRQLCSAMALCPNIATDKVSWFWLLEYYNKNSKRTTLHIFSESYVLSNFNVLRCMSWAVTCSVILLNSIKSRQLITTSENQSV